MKKKIAFSKLSKSEKRIVILKDALKHLNARAFTPATGSIIRIKEEHTLAPITKFIGTELQSVIKQNHCEVCQRGAILFSMVWRLDNYVIDQTNMGVTVTNSDATPNRFVQKFFTQKQLSMMEAAFEGDYGYGLTDKERDRSVAFYDKLQQSMYGDPAFRMRAILNNAIKNKGIFKP